MKKTRMQRRVQLVIMVLPALSILNLPEALADSESDEIVALDLLTVRKPRLQAESRLRVIRLTTRSGATGYGDYLDFGLSAENEEETLARLANRYAAQNHKKNIFLTDPSMRAVGVGHTVMGQTAEQVLSAPPVTGLGVNALFPREGTIFDNSLVFFGGGLRTAHRNTNIPCLLTGSGFKGLTHGQHRAALEENTPLANLWTTMLQDAGAAVDRFADADGTASSVWA
ncbi:MAG: hypothetical protein CMJ78_04200 [Planctomycetaceae bacterium]|nr:hypothetical protein [Planctomycetaceae bacterium]